MKYVPKTHSIITLRSHEAPPKVPALVIASDPNDLSTSKISLEALYYSKALLISGRDFSYVRNVNSALGRLADLYIFGKKSPVLNDLTLPSLIWEYFDYRSNGTKDENGIDHTGLNWKPVQWATLERDMKYISGYSDFCAKVFNAFPLTPDTVFKLQGKDSTSTEIARFAQFKERDFFAHLVPRRIKMKRITGETPTPRPPMRRRKSKIRGRTVGISLLEDDVRRLIDAETNPVYKMIWIMYAYGGVRGSEQLNMWACDTQPASKRPLLFFRDNAKAPLVLLADPSESKWCGKINDRSYTRRQYLIEKYNLLPRPDYSSNSAYRAGWKGMLYTNPEKKISQVWFLDNEYRDMWFDLASQVIKVRSDFELSKKHPYLLINTDERKPDFFGKPTQLSNVTKAWDRACNRVQIDNAGKHSLRHFYKNLAETLNIPKNVRRYLLHHVSEESQDQYGGLFHQDMNNQIERAYSIKNNKNKGLLT